MRFAQVVLAHRRDEVLGTDRAALVPADELRGLVAELRDKERERTLHGEDRLFGAARDLRIKLHVLAHERERQRRRRPFGAVRRRHRLALTPAGCDERGERERELGLGFARAVVEGLLRLRAHRRPARARLARAQPRLLEEEEVG